MVYVKYYPTSTTRRTDLIKPSTQPFYYFINNGDFDIVWPNVIAFISGHAIYFFGFLAPLITNCWFAEKFSLTLYMVFLAHFVGISVTAGAHRLWAHRSYSAAWPLRLLLMIGFTAIGQNCIYIWARDHRVHHKWSDTDADPHNTKRGFFFTHCGWLMRKKHPEMLDKAKTLDFSDLLDDPIVRFNQDYYWLLYAVFSVMLPVAIPYFLLGESLISSFLVGYVNRYVVSLHQTWFVNSASHMFGSHPYTDIDPVENEWVSFSGFGEGYHNYHHSYPNDYRASEDGRGFNLARLFIDFNTWLGLAYDLKTTKQSVVEACKAKQSAIYRKSARDLWRRVFNSKFACGLFFSYCLLIQTRTR